MCDHHHFKNRSWINCQPIKILMSGTQQPRAQSARESVCFVRAAAVSRCCRQATLMHSSGYRLCCLNHFFYDLENKVCQINCQQFCFGCVAQKILTAVSGKPKCRRNPLNQRILCTAVALMYSVTCFYESKKEKKKRVTSIRKQVCI